MMYKIVKETEAFSRPLVSCAGHSPPTRSHTETPHPAATPLPPMCRSRPSCHLDHSSTCRLAGLDAPGTKADAVGVRPGSPAP